MFCVIYLSDVTQGAATSQTADTFGTVAVKIDRALCSCRCTVSVWQKNGFAIFQPAGEPHIVMAIETQPHLLLIW